VLAADTGARRGEQCAARRHVDFAARTVRIETAFGETNAFYEKDTKNHHHCTVTLSEFAVELLYEQRTRHAKACVLSGTELSDDAYVLAPEPGGLTPWHPSNATRAFGRLRDRPELPTWVYLHGLPPPPSRPTPRRWHPPLQRLGTSRSSEDDDYRQHLCPLDPRIRHPPPKSSKTESGDDQRMVRAERCDARRIAPDLSSHDVGRGSVRT
jgi:hypothetical protein